MGNTILLADKSITIQKIVELTFSDENFEIKCVNDGQSALDAILSVQPSIILADINLPVISGYEVCQSLRTDPAYAVYSQVPVILLAGIYETMDEDRARAVEQKVREVGANELLSKPFDPQILTSKVKELVGEGPGAGVSVPDSFQPEAPARGGIFSDMSEPPIPAVEAPPDLFAPQSTPPPPDDSERTMMLPSPMSFAGNIFAEAPPAAEGSEPAPEEPVEEERTIRVESVTPMSEPVFEMSELESAPQPEIEEPVERSMEEEPSEPIGDSFTGREEVEFSMDTQPGVVIAQPSGSDEPPSEAPFVAEPLPSEPEAPQFEFAPPAEEAPFGGTEEPAPPVPDLVTASDDPFGDVFGTVPAPQAWTTTTADEDSPFGVPEPPPAPEPVVEEPEPQMEAQAEAEPSEEQVAEAASQPWAEMPVVMMEPSIPEETPAEFPVDTGAPSTMEEMISSPDLKPDFGEDTWSRARKIAEGPVEELFEGESRPAEEEEELQADQSEVATVQEPVPVSESIQEESPSPASAGGPVEITDELVDRIAARVVAKLSERIVSEIVWQVVPDLAEKMIRRELEKLHAGEE